MNQVPSISLNTYRIKPGETLMVQVTCFSSHLDSKIYIKLKNRVHDFPWDQDPFFSTEKKESGIFLLDYKIPSDPYMTPHDGVYEVQVWKEIDEKKELVCKTYLTILRELEALSPPFLNIIPKPKKIIYEGLGSKIQLQDGGLKISLNIKNQHQETVKNWSQSVFCLSKIKFDSTSFIQVNLDLSQRIKGKFFKDESYGLSIWESNDRCQILIETVSHRGVVHAFRSLAQIVKFVDEAYLIPWVEIYDEPAFLQRGLIEGFYGEPWSCDQRMELLEYLSFFKMNLYFYAPKDDPYHRDLWQKPYPKGKFSELKTLIEKTHSLEMDFLYSLSPGKSIIYSSEAHIKILVEKFKKMGRLGVSFFALLMDDIQNGFPHKKDEIKYGLHYGQAQAELCNEIFIRLQADSGKWIQMVFCPIEYFQETDSTYKKDIRQFLNAEIKVIWTGPGVFSPKMSMDNAVKMQTLYGHKMFLWDNFPVNDANTSTVHLGPLTNRNPNLSEICSSYVSNPMLHCELSKIALTSIADYAWNSAAYDPKASWQESLKFYSETHYKELEIFAGNCLASRIFFASSFELRAAWESWYPLKGSDNSEVLKCLLHLFVQTADKLLNWENPRFLVETKDLLLEWKKESDLLIKWMLLLNLNKKEDKIITITSLIQLEKDLDPLNAFVCDGWILEYIRILKQELSG